MSMLKGKKKNEWDRLKYMFSVEFLAVRSSSNSHDCAIVHLFPPRAALRPSPNSRPPPHAVGERYLVPPHRPVHPSTSLHQCADHRHDHPSKPPSPLPTRTVKFQTHSRWLSPTPTRPWLGLARQALFTPSREA